MGFLQDLGNDLTSNPFDSKNNLTNFLLPPGTAAIHRATMKGIFGDKPVPYQSPPSVPEQPMQYNSPMPYILNQSSNMVGRAFNLPGAYPSSFTPSGIPVDLKTNQSNIQPTLNTLQNQGMYNQLGTYRY